MLTIKKELALLIKRGFSIWIKFGIEKDPDSASVLQKQNTNLFDSVSKEVPTFQSAYQSWYSSALEVVKQVIPDRTDDFIACYKSLSARKEISWANYTISDAIKGIRIVNSLSGEIRVEPKSAISLVKIQLDILEAAKNNIDSVLLNIRSITQADLIDNELEICSELLKSGYLRAAGAIVGIVLEKHLHLVCERANLRSRKKKQTIADYNELLKKADYIDIPTWRRIQHLADLRNLCVHKSKREPTKEEIEDLIHGAMSITKTLF